MTDLINILNVTGNDFCRFALAMLIQSGILIVLLYLIDLLIRKHVRATLRYCIWMLVFVKLILPPTLCLPTGIGYWCGLDIWLADKQISPEIPVKITAREADAIAAQYGLEHLPPAPMVLGQPTRTQFPTVTDDGTYIPPIEASELKPGSIASANQTVPITRQAVVFLIWLVSLLVLSVLLFQRFLFVKILLAQSDRVNGRLDETLQQCCRQVGIRKNIELRLSKNMLSPAVCGLFNPVILMPASLLENLSREKLRAVLIHELVHIKRGDLWVNFVQTILQIIYFYNPLLWFANAMVRGIREKAVDEMVLTKLGNEADSYSNTLIDIAEIAFSRPHFSLRLVGVVESKKALSDRIKHILSRPFPETVKLGFLGFLAIILTALILLPMAKAGSGGPNEKFNAVLSNGVTVELVGICEHPSEGRQWWTPDGKRLDYLIKTQDISGYPSDDPGYHFVFKKSGDISFKIESIKGSDVGSGIQVIEPENLTGYRAHIKKRYKKTNIKIASPSGKWKTAVTSNGQGSVSGKIKGNNIILAIAEKAGKDVIISCSDVVGYKNATRIIAVDSKGKELTGQTKTDTGVNNLRQRTIRFANLELSDIAGFRFQTCPYEYYTFKNVSLKPTGEQPKFVIKGTVTDAETGKPVAGAKVGDNKEYNDGKLWTITDSNGNYEYKTWYEEHFTKCEAAGYKAGKQILLTKLFGSEKEKVIDFALTPEKTDVGVVEDEYGRQKLTPNQFASHTVLSLKTGQLIPKQQADESREPYLYYGYTFPPGEKPSKYTINTIPEQFIGVEAGNMNLAGGGFSSVEKSLDNLWSIETIEQLPEFQPRMKIPVGEQMSDGVFIHPPLDRTWPYITAFKGDDGTYGIFEITQVQNRKIHIAFKNVSLRPGGKSEVKPETPDVEVEGESGEDGVDKRVPAPDKTLRDVLTENNIEAEGLDASLIDDGITGYWVLNDSEVFCIAYYLNTRPGPLSKIYVKSLDKKQNKWTQNEIYFKTIKAVRYFSPGQIEKIIYTPNHVYLRIHTNPSAAYTLVLTKDLKFQTVLCGWLEKIFDDGTLVYHNSQVHFAPTHSAEISIYNPHTKVDKKIYPAKPYSKIRTEHIRKVKAAYEKIGDDWFRNNNHHMDPERFNNHLRSEVTIDNEKRSLSFVIGYDNKDYWSDQNKLKSRSFRELNKSLKKYPIETPLPDMLFYYLAADLGRIKRMKLPCSHSTQDHVCTHKPEDTVLALFDDQPDIRKMLQVAFNTPKPKGKDTRKHFASLDTKWENQETWKKITKIIHVPQEYTEVLHVYENIDADEIKVSETLVSSETIKASSISNPRSAKTPDVAVEGGKI